jgi:hypothetical protein
MRFACANNEHSARTRELHIDARNVEEAALKWAKHCDGREPLVVYVRDVNGTIHTVSVKMVATITDSSD